MVRRWVCGVVMVAVILGALGWSVPVKAKLPMDFYFSEFLGAEVGAFAFGFMGFFELAAACPGKPYCTSERERKDREAYTSRLATWGAARAFGAALGATFVGNNNGVEGNLGMAVLLPLMWLEIGPLWNMLSGSATSLIDRIVFMPLVPAVLAVIGFNIGAKMKDTGQPASLPWTLDLPVLALEF